MHVGYTSAINNIETHSIIVDYSHNEYCDNNMINIVMAIFNRYHNLQGISIHDNCLCITTFQQNSNQQVIMDGQLKGLSRIYNDSVCLKWCLKVCELIRIFYISKSQDGFTRQILTRDCKRIPCGNSALKSNFIPHPIHLGEIHSVVHLVNCAVDLFWCGGAQKTCHFFGADSASVS